MLQLKFLVSKPGQYMVNGKSTEYLLFAFGMKIDTLNATSHLVETDVIEPLKASPVDRFYAMIRDQEVFFPAHEKVFLLHPIFSHQLGP